MQLDNITQEFTRIIVGVQVFVAAIDLPAAYMSRHWKSIAILIGPNMVFGWLVSTVIIHLLLQASWNTAFIIAACLTPTDPVLSASVLGEARFSERIPSRLRHLLSAESGCNDGSSFPFLYAPLFVVLKATAGESFPDDSSRTSSFSSPPSPERNSPLISTFFIGPAVKSWALDIIIWQCMFGIFFGALVGLSARKALYFSEQRGFVQEATLFVFYFLLAIFTVGVGSTLGLDDFLVAFSAGTTFSWDGWFAKKTHKMKLPSILDLMLNSTMFVYFGAIIPWSKYKDSLSAGRMIGCLVLILLLRRIPSILALKRLLHPEIKTYSEALFAGHFGPMGVGAIFLAMEARARLETGSSGVLPHPPKESPHEKAIETIWPVVCFIVLGSIMVHGLSALAMSIWGHFARDPKERAPLLGGEEDRLYGMASHDNDSIEEPGGNESGSDSD